MTDLATSTATELLELYRNGEASPVEAVGAVLERIERLDPTLNAFCLVAGDEALDAATASEARWQRDAPCGPLDGVPTSLKDLLLTKGWPTRRGSRTIDPDQPWDVDAPVTARLREAGAVFVGKTTTPEYGCKGETNSPLTGLTRNPWDRARRPAGRPAAPPPPWPPAWRRSASGPTAPGRCASRRRSAATSVSSRASGGSPPSRCRRSAPSPTSARTR